MKTLFLFILCFCVAKLHAQLSSKQLDSCLIEAKKLQRIDMTPTIGFTSQPSAYYHVYHFLKTRVNSQQIHTLLHSDNIITQYMGYRIAQDRKMKLDQTEKNVLLNNQTEITVGSGCILKKYSFSSLIH